MEVFEDGVWVGLSRRAMSELFPGNARMLGAGTGVRTEVVWEGNFDGHKWHR